MGSSRINYESYIGNNYGYLTILDVERPGGNKNPRFICKCACGNISSKEAFKLLQGGWVTCGSPECRSKLNLEKNSHEIGKRYGRFKIVSLFSESKKLKAICECDCGTVGHKVEKNY